MSNQFTDSLFSEQEINPHTGKPFAHNQQGGSIASNGYKLIYVGKEHHLADVRGYAYEHRIIAENKIGRRLEPGELVHHINEDKLDNRPENLEVLKGNAEHFYRHRNEQSNLQVPGEPNELISCSCGCGLPLLKFDGAGRPRRYISGHNSEPELQKIILNLLAEKPSRLMQIVRLTGRSKTSISNAIQRLKKKNKITKAGLAWVIVNNSQKGGA